METYEKIHQWDYGKELTLNQFTHDLGALWEGKQLSRESLRMLHRQVGSIFQMVRYGLNRQVLEERNGIWEYTKSN